MKLARERAHAFLFNRFETMRRSGSAASKLLQNGHFSGLRDMWRLLGEGTLTPK